MKKQEFKVGDQVRLKKNLKVGKEYGGYPLLNAMVFNGFKEIVDISDRNSIVLQCQYFTFYFKPEMLTKRK